MSAAVFLTALVMGGRLAAAQNIQGVINGRSGATMTLQTQDSGNVVVVLTPATEVDEVEGLFHARKKEWASLLWCRAFQCKCRDPTMRRTNWRRTR